MESQLFELKQKIKYANGSGKDVEASFIELRPPTGKVSHICCDIESLIQSGLVSMSKYIDEGEVEKAKQSIGETPEIDAQSVLAMMTGGGVDMRKMVLNFKELFKEVAFIDGEKPMTTPLLDRMDHVDLRLMMGEYTANFILISG